MLKKISVFPKIRKNILEIRFFQSTIINGKNFLEKLDLKSIDGNKVDFKSLKKKVKFRNIEFFFKLYFLFNLLKDSIFITIIFFSL